ncbi:pentatricopeptide repeat-containing protein 2, mitochondrial [Xyrauchen texanus]|uniref:pentatricopeptide repeat-containing protein 2, mitochondrial n=1 Tax=Xyrauchen texanus TaxID=154827 RepID=UPI0022419EC3|nr:pentatricopeptide repeat-containing protein 2, mitochondrial [Xyrauchen texanus]
MVSSVWVSDYVLTDGLDVVGEMKKQGFNKDTFTLAFATCYKLNTSELYHICLTLLEEGQTKGSLIPWHAYCFATALALKQNDVDRAQTIYSQIMSTDCCLCQNLKVLILVMTGSIKDAISALTTALVSKTPVLVKKTEFSKEVYERKIVLRLTRSSSPWQCSLSCRKNNKKHLLT